MEQDQTFNIVSAEYNRNSGVWSFTFKMKVAYAESFISGYLDNRKTHFRIEDTNAATVSDLGVILPALAIKEQYFIERFLEYIDAHFGPDRKPKPTAEENAAAEKRLRRLDEIQDACEWDKFPTELDEPAKKARAEWKEIMALQTIFEERYC